MSNIFIDNVEYRPFQNRFLISETGTVLRDLTKITPYLRKDGYLEYRGYLVHRMVALCWVPNLNGGKHVHHIDGNKQNNTVTNLEWVTPKIHMCEKHPNTCGKYVRTTEIKEKLRQFHLGTSLTEETKSKIKNSVRDHFQNPDNLAKYREALKTRKNGHVSPCEINGIRYESLSEAARQLNMLRGAVRVRLFSKNFPTWKRLSFH